MSAFGGLAQMPDSAASAAFRTILMRGRRTCWPVEFPTTPQAIDKGMRSIAAFQSTDGGFPRCVRNHKKYVLDSVASVAIAQPLVKILMQQCWPRPHWGRWGRGRDRGRAPIGV